MKDTLTQEPMGSNRIRARFSFWKGFVAAQGACCSLLTLLVASLVVLGSCTGMRPGTRKHERGKAPIVRVCLDKKEKEMVLQAKGVFSVLSPGGKKLLERCPSGSVRISIQASGLYLSVGDGRGVGSGRGFVLLPGRTSRFIYDGAKYAGSMRVVRSGRGLMLINELPVEVYLEGVLPHELGTRDPEEFAALEAQAVAARTYVLSRMALRGRDPFDVYASVQDQVYRGTERVGTLVKRAVEGTRGIVMVHESRLADAYYCSNCGGHTADISVVWPERPARGYLKGVRDAARFSSASFCRAGRYFRWRYSFTGSELGEMLRKTIPAELGVGEDDVGYLRDIQMTARDRTGRVEQVRIVTSKGEFTIHGDRIRWVILSDPEKRRILPSTMFKIKKIMDGDVLAFASFLGGGNGHGVGMCQTGALRMARDGYTYKMILSHYYPGCRLVRKY